MAAADNEINQLLQELDSPDAGVREHAAAMLAYHEPSAAAAIPQLKALLNDTDGLVRCWAAFALCCVEPPEESGVKVLLEELQSEDPEVQIVSAERLGELGQLGLPAAGAIPGLGENLSHADARVRKTVAEALRLMAPASAAAIPSLIRALRDPEWEVRFEAAIALGVLGPIARDSVPIFIEWLDASSEQEARECAAENLANVGSESPDAIQTLGRALTDKDENVRYRAAVGLSEIGQPAEAVYDFLVHGLSDAHAGVVYYCMEALAQLGKRSMAAIQSIELARKRLARNKSVQEASRKARKAILEDHGEH
jgi:HEAT repeat protein